MSFLGIGKVSKKLTMALIGLGSTGAVAAISPDVSASTWVEIAKLIIIAYLAAQFGPDVVKEFKKAVK
jgi:hypothetical protein